MLQALRSKNLFGGFRLAYGLALCLAAYSLSGSGTAAIVWSNTSALLADQGLLGPGRPDAATIEAARQTLYRAADAGLDAGVFADRVHQLEVARWLMLSSAEAQRGDVPYGARAKTYAEWTDAQFRVTEQALLSRGAWPAAADEAGNMQLWSLAVYLYGRAWQTAAPQTAKACLGYGRALLEQQQPAPAEPYLRCALERAPGSAAAEWLMIRALAQEQRWTEAAQALAALAGAAPNAVATGEAAALAAEIEHHAPLAVLPGVRAEWQRQGRNLLANGSFESGYSPWSMWPEPGSNTTLDDQHAYAGLQSLRLDFDGTQDVNYYQVFQVVPVAPGVTYRLTAQIWAEGINSLLAIEVRAPGWFGGVAVHEQSLAGWHAVELDFTPPKSVNEITVTVRRYSGTGLISGTAWVDDLTLLPVAASGQAGAPKAKVDV
jgi:hypothetical protein